MNEPPEKLVRPVVAAPMPPVPVIASTRESLGKHLGSVFIGGLVALIPFFVTLYILKLLYAAATWLSFPVAQWMVTHFLPQSKHGALAGELISAILAVILFLVIVYAIGFLSTRVIGRKLLDMLDHFIENLPLLKGIYGTTKQVISVFRQGGGGAGFQRVVLLEFPRNGLWTLGFVTNEITDSSCGKKYVSVFIPMTPNPTSGFFQLVASDEVRETDWTVDQGIKIVLSGGLLAPREMDFGKPACPDASAAPAIHD